MNVKARLVLLCSVVLSATLTMTSVPVAALDRSGGDFWMYDTSMYMDFMDLGIAEVTGSVKYSYDGTDTITVGGTDYGVSVMKIEGNMAGSLIIADVSLVIAGYSYESKDGIATVKEDVTLLANATMDIGGFAFELLRLTIEQEDTYSPPYISGFDPGDTGTGDSWEETVTATSTFKTLLNDTELVNMTMTNTYDYSFVVASSEQEITTPAGTFDTLVLTVTDTGSGDYEKYWVSEKVRNIVKKETWSNGSSVPSEVLVLSDYKVSNLMIMLIIGAGIGVAVIAVVVLAIVLKRRRAKRTVAPPPPTTPQ